jgi:lysophospholipase L1-like esterase
MKRIALFVLLLVSGGAVSQDSPAANQVTLKKGDRILFYGDSLTEQATKPKGWVTLLREHFKKNHADLDIDVTTFAVGGYPIAHRVKRLDAEVLAKKPTVVVIQGGVPDALRKNITDDEFKSALESMIEQLRKAEVRVILCSCTSLGEKKDGMNQVDKRLDALAKVARQVARDKKVPLNDLRKAFQEYWNKNNPDNKANGILTNDGNHFNDVGNQFVFEHMLKVFATPKSDKPKDQGSEPAITVKKDVVYGNVHGAALLADIAYPEGKKALPVILSVHGGRWVGSHRGDPGEGAIDVKQWAGFGFFAISIDYRLVGCSPPPACYQDVQCAIRWVHASKDKYPIDAERIFLFGMSAGGHLVSLAATLSDGPYPRTGGNLKTSNDIRGVISLSGPYDLEKLSWAHCGSRPPAIRWRHAASPLPSATSAPRPSRS